MTFQRFLGFAAGLTLWGAAALSAQTTGSIVGRVIDESGAPLPGTTVEATSPSLQGARTAVADANGDYRLTLLPPGSYTVSANLQGFAPERRTDVAVRLDQGTTLDLGLRVTASDEITVTGEAPVIDSTSTALGTSLDIRAIQTLPTARNYSSVVQITPGVSSDANPENQGQTTISVYGSSGAENVFYIDGVNTTGVEYGFQGKELNFEFIEAVDVKTGGYQAEFGRATGGVINVVTKSGGNEFHGDLFGYLDNDSLQSSPDPIVSTGGTVEGFTRKDYGIGVGGFLKKDKLWFFAAYDKVSNTLTSSLPDGPRSGQQVDSDSDRKLGAGKLTFRLTESQSLIGSFFQDPRDDTGAINDSSHSLNGDPDTYTGRIELGGKDYALRYQGIVATDWVLTGQVARHEEKNSVGPASAAGDTVQFRDVENNFFQTGGFGLIQDKSFQRDHAGATAARVLGRHDLKLGFEHEKEKADVVRRQSGGQQVDVFQNPLNPNRPIYQHHYWTTPDATVANAPLGQLTAAPEHKNTTLYLQDGWQLRPNLTVNLGVRWDRQQIVDAQGTLQVDLKKDYAPRLGFIWDPTADNRSKVFGSYGRYYEQLPMDLVIRSFSFERQPRIVNFSPTDIHPDAAAEGILGTDSAILGGFTEPSDPNIKGQYLTEVLLGGEREVMPDVAVGAKFIFRKYDRVIEDFLCADDGTYCIGNPGEGIFKQVFTLDYSRTLPAPKPKREYKGVQLDVTKRFSKNWQALASYLYSKLDGNFDGEYAPFTNVGADPNISAAYDYFDFFTNGSDLTRITNNGPLSNERRHQFKVSGIYLTPWKLQVGASAYYRSGTPLTRYGYSDAYGRYEFFLTPRGGEGRGPASYEADLHFGYPVKAGPATINLLLDVFNALNAQKPILLDQRWGFQESDNALPTPTNPGYGRPVLRTAPTSFRVGLRVSF
ncbi:MAG TPA: TonB-dependent receptor [Thermoanaerobaculia bacterium]|nr:TonB-dependent receptor [Thermoanaerobaculia bacterium]